MKLQYDEPPSNFAVKFNLRRSILAHKIFRAAAEQGLSEGRLLLSDWLVILTSHYNAETGAAKFDADDTGRGLHSSTVSA